MKTLAQLAELVAGSVITGDKNIEITGIEHDSRKAEIGTLFVCIAGFHVDGHKFIPQAVEKGAKAILTTRPAGEVAVPEGVAVLQVPELKTALDIIVPFFHDYPARNMRIIGITGTNGKTTTSYLIRAILREAGYKVGLIGTIQIMMEEEVFPIHNTTPDVVELQHTLAIMRAKGMDYVVMEVSSHALDQNRVAGIEFDTAVFSNLTQDHLDYHKTLDNYKLAKAKLFDLLGQKGVKENKTAVVNADDEAGKTMLEHAKCRQLTYGIDNKAALQASKVEVLASGANFTLTEEFLGEMALQLHITGIFNVYNVMAAVGAAIAEKIDPAVIKKALTNFTSVPGRFELVKAGQDFSIIV
ncbi:MAG: UDP-N-acetylmuramoyl-L-alanyl-D-glutamate--2,6-diaminopimelate ligase, partial [Selenomonas sp.]|nr:UDP-N-acetylmuramoyl-L-alanyl-D-glutamate--2,6-diaminopimelate ligase [Selenomonas sp.]